MKDNSVQLPFQQKHTLVSQFLFRPHYSWQDAGFRNTFQKLKISDTKILITASSSATAPLRLLDIIDLLTDEHCNNWIHTVAST